MGRGGVSLGGPYPVGLRLDEVLFHPVIAFDGGTVTVTKVNNTSHRTPVTISSAAGVVQCEQGSSRQPTTVVLHASSEAPVPVGTVVSGRLSSGEAGQDEPCGYTATVLFQRNGVHDA